MDLLLTKVLATLATAKKCFNEIKQECHNCGTLGIHEDSIARAVKAIEQNEELIKGRIEGR